MVAGNIKKRNIKEDTCDGFHTQTNIFLKVRRQVFVGIVCGNKLLLEIAVHFNQTFAEKGSTLSDRSLINVENF